MSSTWGNNIKISIFGESHGKAVGVVIDGLPPGEKIDFDEINVQMSRRRPGNSNLTTQRKESDIPEIMSGIFNGITTGTPVCAVIHNENAIPSNYEENKFLLRPGHADYTGHIRYKGFEDFRGGGHFSGRLTAPLVFAGAVCKQILKRKGIILGSHISSIGEIYDISFDPVNISAELLENLSTSYFPLINKDIKTKMQDKIIEVKVDNDSIGGTIECAIIGVPAGIGNPIFDNIESKISSIIFGIPGVKGIEFGSGFEASKMKGSENNDSFMVKDGQIQTLTNNHGGILGGISSGMPIIFRTAFKPTPSIKKTQKTVNLKDNSQKEINTKGRHDPCIAIRAAPVVEAAAAIAILDLMIPSKGW